MTFLDASAIIAFLAREPDAEAIAQALDAATPPFLVSPLVVFEAVTGLARAKGGAHRSGAPITEAEVVVTAFLAELDAEIVPVSAEIGALALDACRAFGRAAGKQADLNFGDCFAYACARHHGAPLLFKGADFARTDIARA